MDAVQHFEIPYKVRERAKKFYFHTFGWQVFDLPGSDYTLVNTVDIHPNGMPKRPGAINGGLSPRSKESSAPTVLIRVGDVRAHVEKIRHAGGEVLTEPVRMGPVLLARFRDPEGNVLGVIEQVGEEAPADGSKGARRGPTRARSSRTSGRKPGKRGGAAAKRKAPKGKGGRKKR